MFLSKLIASAALSTVFLAAADPLSVNNIYISIGEIAAVVVTVSSATWVVSKKLNHLETLHEVAEVERLRMKDQINSLANAIDRLPCHRENDDCTKPRRH